MDLFQHEKMWKACVMGETVGPDANLSEKIDYRSHRKAERATYRTGRRTRLGVEICEYTRMDRPEESIVVLAYGKSMRFAQLICQVLNQKYAASGGSLMEDTPVPGAF